MSTAEQRELARQVHVMHRASIALKEALRIYDEELQRLEKELMLLDHEPTPVGVTRKEVEDSFQTSSLTGKKAT